MPHVSSPLAIEFDPYAFPCDGPAFGIPHGWNVLTNALFLLVGLWGLARLHRARPGHRPTRGDATGLWVSTALLAFGSGAYHLYLTPFTLALDRICIAGIMAFFAAHAIVVTLGARPSLGRSLLLLLGAEATILIWWLGGTSIAYGAVQGLGGLAVLALYVRACRGGRVTKSALRSVVLFVVIYGLAKLLEVFDPGICEATAVIGGHPIKHVLAAAGLGALMPLTVGDPAPAPR